MSRNGSGVYSLPAGYSATTGQTATAAQHNDPLEDLETDMNTARPVVAGGTGADNAEDARTNLAINPTTQRFTASGTYTPTAGARWAIVEVVGGGGAGGGAKSLTTSTHGGAGGGGGAGGVIRSQPIDVSGASYTSTITIGAGGTGSIDANGDAGGNSSYADGTITLTANGGSGGTMNNDTSTVRFASGAAGGTTSSPAYTPAFATPGAGGGDGIACIDGSSGRSIGGEGASGAFGSGGASGTIVVNDSSTDGGDASGYGAGGGGGACRGNIGAGTAAAGGDGTDGIIIITEFA